MPIDLKSYFSRIGYTGPVDVSAETLKKIHAAQVFSIPFEALAIHELQNVNNPSNFIGLDEDSLFKKLVTDKRGGYCHENNELLALVLTQLGFKVERLAARVLIAPNLPRVHKLLMVTIGSQKWVADVGFGNEGLFEPIPLIENQEINQYGDIFKLIKDNGNYVFQIFNNMKNDWRNLYEFTLEVFKPVDFVPMNYYTSRGTEFIFVRNRLCIMPTPKGRITLNNLNLKIIENGKEKNISLQEGEEYLEALNKYFGIKFPQNTRFKPIPTQSSMEKNPYNFSWSSSSALSVNPSLANEYSANIFEKK